MPLTDVSQKELLHILSTSPGSVVVYLYTPFCGTCKVASRMLGVALETLQHDRTAYQCNLNYAPAFAEGWEITSVPCLIIFHAGQEVNRLYAFHSVDNVYRFLLTHAS